MIAIVMAMPLLYLRRLTSPVRSEAADRHVAYYLAFVAGSINAGGFLAVGQYTSHMSGAVSSMADHLALWELPLMKEALISLGAFISGAFVTTSLILTARRRRLSGEYAFPLLLESLILMFFGLMSKPLLSQSPMVMISLLCFTMGLQNAMITKLSRAVIRTTHMTGIITDIGIRLGRIANGRGNDETNNEVASLHVLVWILTAFFIGGVIGVLEFRRMGLSFVLPQAAILVLISIMPVLDDLKLYWDVPHI